MMQQPCPHCGAYVRAGASFCGTCGKAISAPSVLPTAAVPPPFAAPAMALPAAYLLAADGRRYPLTGQVTRVGRSSHCSLQLPDESVSGVHAEIEARGGGFVLRDVGSTNGTFLNNIEVRGEAPLRPGDNVALGYAVFTFLSGALAVQGLSPAQPPAPAWPVAPPAPTPWKEPVQPAPAPWPGPAVQYPLAPVQPSAPPAPAMWPSPAVQPPLAMPASQDWGNRPPALEGRIVHVDGPHKEQKGDVAGTACAAGCLAIVFTPFMFIPFLFNRDVSVYYLRLEDMSSGQQCAAKIRGEPSGMVSQGDTVALWGRWDGGTLLVKKAYNYNTNAYVKVK